MLPLLFDRDSRWGVLQGCWIGCLARVLDWMLDKDVLVSVRHGYCMECFTVMLHGAAGRSCGWNFWWGCLLEALKEMLDWVFDRDAGWSVRDRVWMLRCVFDRNARLSGQQGCWFECLMGLLEDRICEESCGECFAGLLDWLFYRNAVLSVWRGCWMGCLGRMLDEILDRIACVSVWQVC